MPDDDYEPTPTPRDTAFDAARVLESVGDACYVLDREWRFVYLNAPAERLVRRTRAELLGRSVWEAFPEAVGTVSDRQYRRAVAQRVAVSFEQFYPPLDTWFDVRAFPYEGGLSVLFQNVN